MSYGRSSLRFWLLPMVLLSCGGGGSGNTQSGTTCNPGEVDCTCADNSCQSGLICTDGICVDDTSTVGGGQIGTGGTPGTDKGGTTTGLGGTTAATAATATTPVTCQGTAWGLCSSPTCDLVPGCTATVKSSCTGTASPCSTYDKTIAECAAQRGCSAPATGSNGYCSNWTTNCHEFDMEDTDCLRTTGCTFDYSSGYCNGTPVKCANYKSEAACTTTGPCQWDAYSATFCTGSAVTCDAVPFTSCNTQDGCTATNAVCSGTPTPCTELPVANCLTQPGCTLNGVSGTGGTGGTNGTSAALADLVVSSFTAGEDNDVADPGWSFTLYERNRGVIPSTEHLAKLVFSVDQILGNTDDILLMDLTGAKILKPGMLESNLWSGSYSLSAFTEDVVPAGEYYVGAILDTSAQVKESEETNNTAIAAKPVFFGTRDYNMTPVTLATTAGTSIAVDSTFDVTVTVKNLGNQPLTSIPVALLLSPDTVVDATDRRFCTKTFAETVPVGGQATLTLTCTAPRLRETLYLGAELNATKAIFETDYTNNTIVGNSIAFTATSSDLTVTTVTTDVTDVAYKGSVAITATVTNLGVDAAPDSVIAFYLSTDAVYGTTDYLACQTTLGSTLAAGATSTPVTATCNLPASLAGTYRVIAFVDPKDALFETNEANNTKVATSSLKVAAPDQDLRCDGFNTLYTGMTVGKSYEFGIKISNTQTLAIGSFDVAVYLSTDTTFSTSDEEVCTKTLTNAAAVASTDYTFTCTIPEMAAGAYYPMLVADPDNKVIEFSELNNTYDDATQTIQIVAAP